ncbi:rod-binding protein [bacterium]|nr:rod-binding protein [bacterium]
MQIPGREIAQLPAGRPAGPLSLRPEERLFSFESQSGPLPLFAQEAQAALSLEPPALLRRPEPISIDVRDGRDLAVNRVGEDEASQRARIRSSAQDLEGLLLGTMLKQVWQSLGKDPLFGGDQATKMYREMWLEELSNSIAKGSHSLGIAAMVEREMLKNEGLEAEEAGKKAQPEQRFAPRDAKASLAEWQPPADEPENEAEPNLQLMQFAAISSVNVAEAPALRGSLKGGSAPAQALLPG